MNENKKEMLLVVGVLTCFGIGISAALIYEATTAVHEEHEGIVIDVYHESGDCLVLSNGERYNVNSCYKMVVGDEVVFETSNQYAYDAKLKKP